MHAVALLKCPWPYFSLASRADSVLTQASLILEAALYAHRENYCKVKIAYFQTLLTIIYHMSRMDSFLTKDHETSAHRFLEDLKLKLNERKNSTVTPVESDLTECKGNYLKLLATTRSPGIISPAPQNYDFCKNCIGIYEGWGAYVAKVMPVGSYIILT